MKLSCLFETNKCEIQKQNRRRNQEQMDLQFLNNTYNIYRTSSRPIRLRLLFFEHLRFFTRLRRAVDAPVARRVGADKLCRCDTRVFVFIAQLRFLFFLYAPAARGVDADSPRRADATSTCLCGAAGAAPHFDVTARR